MMKRILQILFSCIITAIITGYGIRSKDVFTGDRIIGIAVLALTFVLMPIFIFYRYRKSRIQQYLFPGKQEKENTDTIKDQ